jgi:DNA-directed RNA polymerase sigma subunit (sigma70/sigma32)
MKPYREQLREMREKRLVQIRAMRAKNWSFERIGRVLGIRRQRVHQILKAGK